MSWDDDLALEILTEFTELNRVDERIENGAAWLRARIDFQRLGFNRREKKLPNFPRGSVEALRRNQKQKETIKRRRDANRAWADRVVTEILKHQRTDSTSMSMREWWYAQPQAVRDRMKQNLFRGSPWYTLSESQRQRMMRLLQDGRKRWWDSLSDSERQERKVVFERHRKRGRLSQTWSMVSKNKLGASVRKRWAEMSQEERRWRLERLQQANANSSGIDWDTQPLGLVKDAELAHKLGVTRTCVAKARRRRGIKRLR